MAYTPGQGGVVLAAATTAPTAIVATTLPQTGMSMVNEIAISVAAGMAVWALVYLKLRKTS
jgi:LPXTG-motif cell wall-anchored protein